MLSMPSALLKLFSVGVLLAASLAPLAHAQGGPPFRTDDPDTPGNKHWEINIGFIGTRNPAAGAYQVPDIDINYGLGDHIQLKYEVPLAIEETRAQPAGGGVAATPGQVIGGIGESVPGIKWRYYEHHTGDPWLKGAFGTGLLGLFQHKPEPERPAGDAPGADQPTPEEKPANLEFGTYPQLYLDNPGRAVPRGLVAPGPHFYLPVEVSFRVGPIRVNGDAGYDFGNRQLPQAWNRGFLVGQEFSDRTEAYVEFYDQQDANRVAAGHGVGNFATGLPKQRQLTLDVGGRQALNQAKTVNLLLMGGRAIQTVSVDNSQPSWIAYVGVQVLLGPKGSVAEAAPLGIQGTPRAKP
jgi:hypothetical protein